MLLNICCILELRETLERKDLTSIEIWNTKQVEESRAQLSLSERGTTFKTFGKLSFPTNVEAHLFCRRWLLLHHASERADFDFKDSVQKTTTRKDVKEQSCVCKVLEVQRTRCGLKWKNSNQQMLLKREERAVCMKALAERFEENVGIGADHERIRESSQVKQDVEETIVAQQAEVKQSCLSCLSSPSKQLVGVIFNVLFLA